MPEECIFPFGEVLRFVHVWQEAGEDAHTVEDFGRDGLIRVFVDSLGLKEIEAADGAVDQGLGVLGGSDLRISRWPIGGGVECESTKIVGRP